MLAVMKPCWFCSRFSNMAGGSSEMSHIWEWERECDGIFTCTPLWYDDYFWLQFKIDHFFPNTASHQIYHRWEERWGRKETGSDTPWPKAELLTCIIYSRAGEIMACQSTESPATITAARTKGQRISTEHKVSGRAGLYWRMLPPFTQRS